MRVNQLHILGTLFLAAACSGTVNNYYINAGGGSNAGAAATGGASVSGGSRATGGAPATGGSNGTAGVFSTAIGGAHSSGGTPATGGSSALGGNSATGGKSSQGGTGTNANAVNGIVPLTQLDYDQIASAACVGWSVKDENSSPVIDFVVDASGSMGDTAPNTTDGRSKWMITSAGLQTAIDALPSSAGVGMLVWPNMATVPNQNTTPIDASNCVNEAARVPLAALGTLQRDTLASALASAEVLGGTPMADAYNYALGSGTAAQLPGARHMVLITDGQPTIQLGCMGTGEESRPVDFSPVLSSIANAWSSLGVKTFVIGSPGSQEQSSTAADGRTLLSQAAVAGGTAPAGCSATGPNWCHFDMSSVADFATGFAAAIQNITGQVLSCDFGITNVPSGQIVNPSQLNVIYEINGSSALGDMRLIVPSDVTCPQGNGWYLDPNDSTHLVLCANTCSLVHNDVGAVLNIVGGCSTIVKTN